MTSNRHFDDQIAIYALGALPAGEREELEAHLRDCASCRAKLSEARALVHLLPRSVEPVQPSPETKRGLFARVEADLAQEATGRPQTVPVVRSTVPRGLRLSVPTLAVGLAAVLILVVLGLVGGPFVAQLNQQREIVGILNNPSSQTRLINGTKDAPAAQGKLVAAPGETRGVLMVSGLMPLPQDKTYEFWLIRGAQTVPAGLFNVDSTGGTTLLISAPQDVRAFDKLGVTIEQRAGELTPKGTLVMQYGF